MTHLTLSVKQKTFVPIAAFSAIGDLDQLRISLENGLNLGLSISELKEVLVQIYPYAGFPRSLNSLNVLMKLVEHRKCKGIYYRY